MLDLGLRLTWTLDLGQLGACGLVGAALSAGSFGRLVRTSQKESFLVNIRVTITRPLSRRS